MVLDNTKFQLMAKTFPLAFKTKTNSVIFA